MNELDYAYMDGLLTKAAEYGVDHTQMINILKTMAGEPMTKRAYDLSIEKEAQAAADQIARLLTKIAPRFMSKHAPKALAEQSAKHMSRRAARAAAKLYPYGAFSKLYPYGASSKLAPHYLGARLRAGARNVRGGMGDFYENAILRMRGKPGLDMAGDWVPGARARILGESLGAGTAASGAATLAAGGAKMYEDYRDARMK